MKVRTDRILIIIISINVSSSLELRVLSQNMDTVQSSSCDCVQYAVGGVRSAQ